MYALKLVGSVWIRPLWLVGERGAVDKDWRVSSHFAKLYQCKAMDNTQTDSDWLARN
jgi:hypothetical protein